MAELFFEREVEAHPKCSSWHQSCPPSMQASSSGSPQVREMPEEKLLWLSGLAFGPPPFRWKPFATHRRESSPAVISLWRIRDASRHTRRTSPPGAAAARPLFPVPWQHPQFSGRHVRQIISAIKLVKLTCHHSSFFLPRTLVDFSFLSRVLIITRYCLKKHPELKRLADLTKLQTALKLWEPRLVLEGGGIFSFFFCRSLSYLPTLTVSSMHARTYAAVPRTCARTRYGAAHLLIVTKCQAHL